MSLEIEHNVQRTRVCLRKHASNTASRQDHVNLCVSRRLKSSLPDEFPAVGVALAQTSEL